MANDVKNYKLFDNQEKAVAECISSLNYRNGALLVGEVGSGKTAVSLTIAHRLGYKNVIYITEARLISKIEYHSELTVFPLKYTKFRIKKNSRQEALKVAKKILEDLPDDCFVICDEVHNISNIGSQMGKVFIALRYLLRDSKMLFMSGTIKNTCNSQLAPFLSLVKGTALKNLSHKEVIDLIKGDINQYTQTIPKRVNTGRGVRIVDERIDCNTEDLKRVIETFSVRLEKKRKGDITLYSTIVDYTTDPKTIKIANKLKSEQLLRTKNEDYVVRYNNYQFPRLADGFYEISEQFNLTKKKLVELKNQCKINALKKVIAMHPNDKILILCAFRKSAEIVAEKTNALLYDVENKNKDEIFNNFKNSNESVLVSTVSALSTGFNLDHADVTIYYSMSGNNKDLTQSKGRIDRASSVNDKYYYFLRGSWSYEYKKVNHLIERMVEVERDFGFAQEMVEKVIKV